MAYRKNSNIIQLKLRIILIENVLTLREQKKTMREIGEVVGKSRTEVQNIIDSNK